MSATNSADYEHVSPYFRRAGGRRGYNAARQRMAHFRRHRIVGLLREIGMGRGCASKIARRLGVHRSTVCRDLQYLDRQYLDLLVLHGFAPWQLALIPRDDRTIDKLGAQPVRLVARG